MAIKFLKDYEVGTPPEKFTAGDIVKDREAASEAHFVRRGVAAYLGDKGELTDIDGNTVVIVKAAPEAKTVKNERAQPDAVTGS